MRKQLGLLTTLIVFCASTLGWAAGPSQRGYGYSNYSENYYAENPYPNGGPRRPVNAPVYQQGPQQYANPSKQLGSSRISCDGVIVTATQPQLCILGDNYALDLTVQACIDVCHVEVNAMLPDGVSLVRSEPEGAVAKGDTITWTFDSMRRGEVRKSRILLRADREGDLCACFCVTAVPVAFCKVLCAKPVLECTKCGPQEVCPGDPVHYTITVTNKGSCAAEEVVVTDNVPAGLEHSSGLRTLTFKLGTLESNQTKTLNVCFTAVQRGRLCNRITVSACNASPSSCEFCTNVCKECVELTKVGPKEVPIGKTADYEITVFNPGDKPLTEVVLVDQAPAATSIVEARGATVNGNQAVWKFRELKPGEKQTVNLTLTTCTAGYYVNRVSVDNCQRCRATAEWGTRWRGRPSLNVSTEESGQVCVGEVATYTIRVTNQGSEEDSNLNVVIDFPGELTPVSAAGASQGTVNGQTVTFAPLKIFGPRQTAEFKVDAQAKTAGDARIKIRVSSDSIKTPIVEEESTIIN